jgi:CheY-like chemotaxis protein
VKSTYIPNTYIAEGSGRRLSADLEDAGYKLLRASAALDNAMQVLIKNYPDLVILANQLPMVNGQHPYLRIEQAANLCRYFHYQNIALTPQLA